VKRAVFLSYSASQAAIATRIELVLTAAGYSVFRDRSDLPPGEAFDARLRDAITTCDLFLFLISPESVTPGRYTLTELKFAEERWRHPAGHVLPVVVAPTPIADIPEYLKAVTLLEPQGDIAAEVAATVQRLVPRRRLPASSVAAVLAALVVVAAAGIGLWLAHRSSQAAGAHDRQVAAVVAEARHQSDAGNYREAWGSLDRSLTTYGEVPALLDAQQVLAMRWLENARGNADLSLARIADTMYPILARGAANSTGAKAADLVAHMGWADFLRTREGDAGRQPIAHYQRAVSLDPANPYAHAMWGFELIRTRRPIAEGQSHFGAALKSGREREFVRHLQISALLWFHTPDLEDELIRVVNEIRRGGEAMPVGFPDRPDASRVWDVYQARLISGSDRERFLRAIDSADHVDTFKWLFAGKEFPPAYQFQYGLAQLEEAAGRRASAAAAYEATLRELGTRGEAAGPLVSASRDALKRLARQR
jgi:tetratricopeptide (TPR) repeat protein